MHTVTHALHSTRSPVYSATPSLDADKLVTSLRIPSAAPISFLYVACRSTDSPTHPRARRVDFGVCHLGETVTKVYTLECKVPIQFAFEIKTVEPHPDISVSPMKGIIPASGKVDVTITFRPASLSVRVRV